MRYCEDCIHHSIVTRYDPADHDRAYDLARCGLTGEETDDIPDPCDEWAGDVDSMQAHIDGLQDELRHVEAIRHQYAAELDAYDETHMRLPVDADGVPIRLHDKMEDADGMTFPAKSIHFTSEDWDDGSWWVNEARFDPKELRHAKPRTVEDVLRDCCNEWNQHAGKDWESGVYAKYADELRELMGGDA